MDLIEEDLLFHRTIFEMSGNRVCRLMFSIVHELLHNLMEMTSRMVDLDHTVKLHSRIIQRHTQTRRAEARGRMVEHLTEARGLSALSPDAEEIAHRRAILEAQASRCASAPFRADSRVVTCLLASTFGAGRLVVPLGSQAHAALRYAAILPMAHRCPDLPRDCDQLLRPRDASQWRLPPSSTRSLSPTPSSLSYRLTSRPAIVVEAHHDSPGMQRAKIQKGSPQESPQCASRRESLSASA